MTLLSVDGLRAYITTSLDDPSVQALLDAAEDDLRNAWGSPDLRVSRFWGGFTKLPLDHRPGTIVSVKESAETASPLTLATNDYEVDGYLLRRLTTGTNPAYRWHGLVELTDTAVDDTPARQRAQLALVRLDMSVAGGVTSERVGDWAVSYASDEYQQRRSDILASGKPAMAR